MLVAAAALAGCGGSGAEEPATSTSPAAAPAEEDVIATIDGAEDAEVTGADLEEEVLASAAAEGRTPPAAGSPEFDLVAGDALDRLLLRRWIAADVAEQGAEVTEEEAAALADRMNAAGARELHATWAERTECDTDLISRFCGGDGGADAPEPPPDIPPASGLEEPRGG